MQEKKEYVCSRVPVKPKNFGTAGQQVTCRMVCRGGVLRLVGTLAEGWRGCATDAPRARGWNLWRCVND